MYMSHLSFNMYNDKKSTIELMKTDLFIPLLNSNSLSPLGMVNTRITVPWREC